MQALAVAPQILRAVVGPDIKIVPGRAVMARVVVAEGTGRGSLSIAGFLVDAELPKDVRAGQDLRLVIKDVSAERVLLTMSDDRPDAAQQAGQQSQLTTPELPPGAVPVPVPGGGMLAVTERDAHGGRPGDGTTHSVALRYTTPELGAMDLHFTLDAGSLAVTVSVPPGPGLPLAQADAETLRQTLAEQLQRAVSVTVKPRREPLDLYA